MAKTLFEKDNNRKIKSVPVLLQMEALECGAVCLAMILSYYGCWVPIEETRSACGISRDGSKASKIMRAARNYGLQASGFKTEAQQLQKLVNYPAILFWENRHFVVFCGYKNGKYYINDPADGRVVYKEDEFLERYSGVCLSFSPTSELKIRENEKNYVKIVMQRIKENKRFLFLVCFITAVSVALGAALPYFDRYFYGNVLENSEKKLGIYITIFILFSIASTIFTAISDNLFYRMRGKMDVNGTTQFVKKILRLPFEFFSQRWNGDLVKRKSANATVTKTLVETAGPLLVNACMMLVYFFLMLKLSPMMAIVCIVTVALSIVVMKLSSDIRINALRLALRDDSEFYSASINGIERIETLRAHGAEKAFLADWLKKQTRCTTRKNKYAEIEGITDTLSNSVFKVSGMIILGLGVYLILKGDFTLGILAQFQGFMTAFYNPATTLIQSGKELIESNADIERINDVLKNANDPLIDHALKLTETASKLTGDISIRNLTFGYSIFEDPILKDVSIDIKAGQCVSFVGTSGSGKSTIAKLMGGLYEPWDGEILYDGKRIEEIPRSIYTRSLTIADQEITLFSDTVRNNIKLWDDSIEDFEMILAANDAGIRESIMRKPEGFDYIINKNQQGFSGGEKQRIEIARVLAEDPTIAIFDEATSNLDAITEYKVMEAIRKRGITCIFIAHRLSTIRDCDKIFVLDEGRIAESGTHEELLQLGGIYYSLVTDQEAAYGMV